MTLEYVSGAEFCFANNAIGVFVLNTSDLTATTRIIVNQESGGTSTAIVDTGTTSVTPTASFGFSLSVLTAGIYWIQIFVSTNELVPNARFVAIQGTTPITIMSYAPTDFAVFDRKKI
jgi:hypothetical protein